MNLPQVYMCSPSWTPLPPPSPYHPSGSSQSTSPKHPVSCIEPGLATRFIHDILHVSMPFSQIFQPSPSPTESIRLFYTSVSLLLSRIAIDSLNLAQKVTSQDKNYVLQPPLQLIVATWQNSRQLDVKESEAGNFLGETLKGRVMIFFPTPFILLI